MSDWDRGYQLGLKNGLELGRKAERERLARDIEALPADKQSDLVTRSRVLRVVRGERCPECDATQPEGHVLGCPVPDVPR